jgi:predicted nucleic acid-binding protein
MRVLLDTNIVLDALLNRQPFVAEAQQILQANDQALVSGYITATTITDFSISLVRRLAQSQL